LLYDRGREVTNEAWVDDPTTKYLSFVESYVIPVKLTVVFWAEMGISFPVFPSSVK
jgi:hypothetical protein